ncbi:MAG: YicC family protein [Verrucomicrobiales bacterium]|jgi:uncharacterized protein (TIGR00255 family)|nr:YicC family protein [Verrucomicrobiales bacterium]
MKSMTGFGKKELRWRGGKVLAEVASVNSRKGLDVSVSAPREHATLEGELRELVQRNTSRGRVMVSVTVERNEAGVGGLGLNRVLLKKYHREIGRLAKELRADGQVSLEFLLRLPGVLGDARADDEAREKILAAVEQALALWHKSRAREGQFLCKTLAQHLGSLDKVVADIEQRKDAVLSRYRRNLQKRLADDALTVNADDERLAKELVIFSDRCDITEEVTRLRAHFQEGRRLLRTADTIGRNLDFLLQEIGREVNTIGSKANDLDISRRVVELKTELEKIREQVQNLE